MSTTRSFVQREPSLLRADHRGDRWQRRNRARTARRARPEGAEVILTGRNPERLELAGREIAARRTAAFDANDPPRLDAFFRDLPTPIDHVMVTAGRPSYGPLMAMDPAVVRSSLEERLLLVVQIARDTAGKLRPGGTLVFMSGTHGGHPHTGLGIALVVVAALPALIANLALDLAPVRINLIAAGFVDTGLSASLLGDDLEKRRKQLRDTLPFRRVVQPADIAALAIHLMTNTAITGRRTTSMVGSSSSNDHLEYPARPISAAGNAPPLLRSKVDHPYVTLERLPRERDVRSIGRDRRLANPRARAGPQRLDIAVACDVHELKLLRAGQDACGEQAFTVRVPGHAMPASAGNVVRTDVTPEARSRIPARCHSDMRWPGHRAAMPSPSSPGCGLPDRRGSLCMELANSTSRS